MAENLGEKIRRRRTSLGLTLDGLATQVDSTKAYIWQLENKKVARPSAALLLRVASALSISPDYLIDDTMLEPSDNHAVDALFRKIKQRNLTTQDIETLISVSEGLAKNRE